MVEYLRRAFVFGNLCDWILNLDWEKRDFVELHVIDIGRLSAVLLVDEDFECASLVQIA